MISLCAPCQELSCPQWGHSFSFSQPSVQCWASDRSLYCSTGKVGQPDGPAGDMWRPQNSALEIDNPSLDTGEEGKKDPCARKWFELWPEVDHYWRLNKVLGILRMIDSCYQWKDLVQRGPRSKFFREFPISPDLGSTQNLHMCIAGLLGQALWKDWFRKQRRPWYLLGHLCN